MEEPKCPVCKTQYTQLNPPRLLTMCGHTFCHQCIKTFIKRKQYRYQVRCPEDKLKLSLDSPTPSQFPRNMIVVEAMNKHKPKVEGGEEKNEFLSGFLAQHCEQSHKQSCRSSAKHSLLCRSSVDQGRCLLHQKPLDIICLQEKAHICAECALFGIHKGHVCSTLKDLQVKRKEWIHQISEIIQERKLLLQKMSQTVMADSLNSLLQKKKQELFAQAKQYFQKLQKMLQLQEKELKDSIQVQLSILEKQLVKNVNVSEKREQVFQSWQKQVLDSMQYLETDDIVKQIAFFSGMLLLKDQNLISKGRNIIKQLKQEQQNYWHSISIKLQYPKLKYDHNIQQEIRTIVELIRQKQCPFTIQKKKISKISSFDTTVIQAQKTPEFEQVSLLDFTDSFKYKFNMSTINDSHNVSKILTDNSFLPNLDTSSQLDISSKVIKKVKSKDSLFNSSLCKLSTDKRNIYNSPKYRKKTEFVSKGTIPPPSPVFLKNKLKRNHLKVKDPQKYQKIIKALEADTLQIVDFTGFEMGDENAKEVCQKLKNCSKVKSLRLMKNQLTDEILKQLFEVVPRLEIINLSQNSFTSKVFQILQQEAKKDKSNKVKYIQLGQNNINPRKYKQKLQSLKQLGYIVSL